MYRLHENSADTYMVVSREADRSLLVKPVASREADTCIVVIHPCYAQPIEARLIPDCKDFLLHRSSQTSQLRFL